MSNDTFRDYLDNKLGSIDSHVSELIPDTAELRAMRANNPELYRDFIDRWLTTIDGHIVDIINGGGIHPGPTPPTPTIYDYYYENIPCLDTSPRTIINLHDTFTILKSSETRDWEVLINFENHQTDTSERPPFGISEPTGSPAGIELYMKGQTSNTFIYHRYIDGTTTSHNDIIGTGNLNNTDIIFKKTGSNLDILVNNSVVLTIPLHLRNINTRNAILGAYYGASQNYYFEGIINKFGFRWL